MKLCSACKLDRPLDAFSRNKNCATGLASRCKDCQNAYGKLWREKNPQRVQWLNKQRHITKKDAIRRQKLLTLYGTDGSEIAAQQQGLCAVCQSELSALPQRHRHIDHDHTTGKVRGVLCHWCNLGLGKFKDNPALLRAAALYLEGHQLV